jgi:protein-tyrosine phosphatase
MGVGRSSCLVLAHLLASRFKGAGVKDALDFLSARRPLARPNPEQIQAAVEAAAGFPG